MRKYNNKKVTHFGIKFDSKKEGARFLELKKLLNDGKIKDLLFQPVYLLQDGFKDQTGKKHRPITYRADFQYFDNEIGKTIIEDSKGFRTDVYRLKLKLFLKKLPELFKDFVFIES